MSLTYENQNGRIVNRTRRWGIDVRKDGAIIGQIVGDISGYSYIPKGKRKASLCHSSLERLKQYLEEAAA